MPDIQLGQILHTEAIEPLDVVNKKLAVRAEEVEALVGALADSAVTDPALSASMIALLKGILTDLATLHTDMGTTLHGDVDGVEAQLTTIQGYIDGLEALVTATNTKLDTLHADIGTTLHGDVDGLETKLDTLHTDIGTTVHADLGGTTDAPVTAGATGSISAKLRRLSTDLDALLTKMTDGNQTVKLVPGAAPAGDAQTTTILPLQAFNGTNYDRIRVDAQKNLLVGLRDASGNVMATAAGNAVPAAILQVGGRDASGLMRALGLDSNFNLLVAHKTSFNVVHAAPVVGAKTVTTSAAEIFGGSSRLASRYSMAIYNESSVTVYWGPSGVATTGGFPILPGDSVVLTFDPYTATAIYLVASASAAVRVVELA